MYTGDERRAHVLAPPGRDVDTLVVPQQHRLPELTDSELRLLPLLATPLSFAEIGRLLGAPRDEILADALAIYSKLGLLPAEDARFAES